ncbi:MAG TPA: Lrp/AsnC family transcriptional regulator [Jatrophihabitantaceae bacterium]|jgi:Lrp/AsnC family transcriptional regulator for asnA, asnC and gidA
MAQARRRSVQPTGTPLRTIRDHAATPSAPVTLDATDLRLLRLLSRDARFSQRSLARDMKMSAPAIAERIARLERQRVINGYGVRVDWSALGYQTTVYLTITAVPGYQLGLVMNELAEIPEIDEVLLVTGPFDMLVRMRARDEGHLRDLLLNRIWQIEGIQRTETSITIAQMKPKNTAEELLTAMLDDRQSRDAGSTG